MKLGWRYIDIVHYDKSKVGLKETPHLKVLQNNRWPITLFLALQDRWDSIQNNDYFSIEGAKDVIRQVGLKASLRHVLLLCTLNSQSLPWP